MIHSHSSPVALPLVAFQSLYSRQFSPGSSSPVPYILQFDVFGIPRFCTSMPYVQAIGITREQRIGGGLL